MTRSKNLALVAGLLALSAALYAALWALYPARLADIGFYTLLDVAFIPLSVLIVGLVVNGLLERREREAMLNKLNMVIGAFFSEVGTELIDRLVSFDTDIESLRGHMIFRGDWTDGDFEKMRLHVSDHASGISVDAGDLDGLKVFLVARRAFLLRLLENQNLLEHESFTDVLWAVFHLTEELAARPDLGAMPPADRRHVEMDMERAYGRLLAAWLGYASHLKNAYPYLFSFALRTNPFDPTSDIRVKS
jgi:hypothetical protein